MRMFTVEIKDINGFVQIKAEYGNESSGTKLENEFANAASNAITWALGHLTKDGPIIQEEGSNMEKSSQLQLDIIRSGQTK